MRIAGRAEADADKADERTGGQGHGVEQRRRLRREFCGDEIPAAKMHCGDDGGDDQSQNHKNALHHIGDGNREESAQHGVAENDAGGEKQAAAGAETKAGTECLAAGFELRRDISDHEQKNYHCGDDAQQAAFIIKFGLKIIRQGDGVKRLCLSAQRRRKKEEQQQLDEDIADAGPEC